jgi:integrase
MSLPSGATAESAQVVNRAQLTPEEAELLSAFDRNETSYKGKYNVQFSGDKLIIAGKPEIDIKPILDMDGPTVLGFKLTIQAIAERGSRAPGTLAACIGRFAKAVRDYPIANFSPENYPLLIENAAIDTKGALRSVLTIWHRLGYPGISSETIDVVNALRPPSSRGRARVTSEDPTEGWYTDQEFDDLVDTYWIDYEAGKMNLRNTTTLLLVAQFGKRGIQLASLKVCDFQSEGETEGLKGKRVAFPGVKDRSAEEWFRGSKFEIHAVGDDLWNLCMKQRDSTITFHEKLFGRELTQSEREKLPFLQTQVKPDIKQAIKQNANNIGFTIFEGSDAATAVLHASSGSLSQNLLRLKGTKVISYSTGETVREFAYRMRYTRARQLARLGVPRTTLQYWLGHENDASLDHYYNDPAEDARRLDIEMQTILAPLAQAFLGALRDKESDAIRGNEPSSRIELDGRHNVGTCGEHGFCSASVPIPCYRCSKFQPWVDAPHDEVLIRLIERQEEENNIHLPSKTRRLLVPLQLEKDIAAVKLVIRLCDARKRELETEHQGAEHPDELNQDS